MTNVSSRCGSEQTTAALRFELRHSDLGRAAAVASPLVELALFGILISYGEIAPESAATFIGLLLVMSLAHSWFVFGARYEVRATTLSVIHGPWRREIALDNVLQARLLRTLDRGAVVELDLAYGRRLLLSPVDRDAFLDALEARQPNLRMHVIEPVTRGR